MTARVLATVVAVVIGAWSCSIDRPSEALKCSAHSDCAQFPGTICSSNYCITGTLPIDARELDAFVCPAACTSCDTSATAAVCNITGAAGASITCPPGFNCDITCGQAGACGPIDCGSADCNVTCVGVNACGSLTCSGGDCTETCMGGAGSAVCGNMTCSSGSTCTRTCSGAAACGTQACSGMTACIETCSGGAAACGALTCGTGLCRATCTGPEGACGNVTCASACRCDVVCSDVGGDMCPGTMTCPDPNGGQVNECEDAFGRCDSSETPARCRDC